jgi:putative Mg2+ transporter-C (MgtC) family protein
MESFLDVISQGVSPLVIVLRLCAAAALGAALGWDRESRDKPAGLRTHMLVSIGSAVFTVLGFESGEPLAERYGEQGLDPTRIVQGIVGGLGFLCAGSIIKQGTETVSGLTTAASLWVTGALGVACGMGAFLLAGVATALALVVLSLVHGSRRPG